MILWILTIIGALFGGFELLNTFLSAQSAPQQAAGAAMAVGCVVLPYCLARAVSELGKHPLAKSLEIVTAELEAWRREWAEVKKQSADSQIAHQ